MKSYLWNILTRLDFVTAMGIQQSILHVDFIRFSWRKNVFQSEKRFRDSQGNSYFRSPSPEFMQLLVEW